MGANYQYCIDGIGSMKKVLISIIMTLLLFTGCDLFEEDEPELIKYSVIFKENVGISLTIGGNTTEFTLGESVESVKAKLPTVPTYSTGTYTWYKLGFDFIDESLYGSMIGGLHSIKLISPGSPGWRNDAYIFDTFSTTKGLHHPINSNSDVRAIYGTPDKSTDKREQYYDEGLKFDYYDGECISIKVENI